MAQAVHSPVMPQEVMRLLDPRPGATVVDATVGAGGHSSVIACAIGEKGRLIAIDRDPDVLEHAKRNLERAPCRVDIVRSNFRDLARILEELNAAPVDGILIDLGVSSLQLDDAERGFSFLKNGPLDMRMDPEEGQSAARIVSRLSEKMLCDILHEFGEERFARRIARAIVWARKKARIDTTARLAEVVCRAVPSRRTRIHPATRTFMALRIYVNRELECLERVLEGIEETLSPGGRLVIIAFHSLEDRIVKNALREKARSGAMKILTKKPITASEKEVSENPRSRSAKLRAAERA